MKILLTCCSGMSTSLLVEMMNQYSVSQNREDTIWCIDIDKAPSKVEECDILLLGPQVRHSYKRFYKQYGKRIPVAMISSGDYGRLDGKRVLEQAIQLYTEFHENGNYIAYDEELEREDMGKEE